MYTFEASVSTTSCNRELKSELTSEVRRTAERYTSNLECRQEGSCHLELPEVSECTDTSSSSRARREAEEDTLSDLKFKISLVYSGRERKKKNTGIFSIISSLMSVTILQI